MKKINVKTDDGATTIAQLYKIKKITFSELRDENAMFKKFFKLGDNNCPLPIPPTVKSIGIYEMKGEFTPMIYVDNKLVKGEVEYFHYQYDISECNEKTPNEKIWYKVYSK